MENKDDVKGVEEEVEKRKLMLEKYLVKEVKIPCVYYDPEFLGTERGTRICAALVKDMQWKINDKTNRHTVLYGDSGVEYQYRDQPSTEVCLYYLSVSFPHIPRYMLGCQSC